MDELVKLVQERTGMPEEKAQQAVETVLAFMKTKLPAPLAAQMDAALKNDAVIGQAGALLDVGADKLGGLLGKKR